MKQKLVTFAILVAMASCQQKQEVVKEETPPIKVVAQSVQISNASTILRYSGTIEASQTIPLSFQSAGKVERVLVQEGDAVKKGQLLATTDKSDYISIYNSSLASYQQAKDAYDRLKQVYDKGSLSEVKWVEMETNLKHAESQLEISKSNLDKCNLYAPTNGIVGSRDVEPGQSALTSFTPIELVKIETLLVKISVPENEIGKIKKGMTATFTISALNNKNFEGEVTHVGVVADKFSRTYNVKVAVDNTHMEMKPGMVCDVSLDTENGNTIVVVPNCSVSKDTNGNAFVYLVSADNKRVKKQIVTLGDYRDSGIEVLSGLAPNQTIIVKGKEKLSENSQIIL